MYRPLWPGGEGVSGGVMVGITDQIMLLRRQMQVLTGNAGGVCSWELHNFCSWGVSAPEGGIYQKPPCGQKVNLRFVKKGRKVNLQCPPELCLVFFLSNRSGYLTVINDGRFGM